MTVSHKASMNLRFVLRDGKRILQQQFYPNNWDTHKEVWRDVELRDERPDDYIEIAEQQP